MLHFGEIAPNCLHYIVSIRRRAVGGDTQPAWTGDQGLWRTAQMLLVSVMYVYVVLIIVVV